MSDKFTTFEAPAEETDVIRKAKYRVKNNEGQYEVVYLETSADQVIETADKKFVTAAEKELIASNSEAMEAVDEKVNTAKTEAIQESKNYTNQKIGEIDGAYKAADTQTLEQAKQHANQQVTQAKNELNGKIDPLTQKVTTNESAISDLRNVIAKNTTTYVVKAVANIAEAVTAPKVGDLVYVVDDKKAYIYKGVETEEGGPSFFEAPAEAPDGWVLFDEITSEVDLAGYVTSEHAEATYMKKTDKVNEDKLEDGLKNKINGKLDASAVDGKINAIVDPVKESVSTLEGKVNQKIDASAVPGEVNKIVNPIKSALEEKIGTKLDQAQVNNSIDGKLNPAKTELTQAINQKGQEVTQAFQAADTQLTNKINNLVPTLAKEQPGDKAEGHVWLQIVGEDE